jgi:uncharacterized membrane-anchored protein YhcB (DUF1043 family)
VTSTSYDIQELVNTLLPVSQNRETFTKLVSTVVDHSTQILTLIDNIEKVLQDIYEHFSTLATTADLTTLNNTWRTKLLDGAEFPNSTRVAAYSALRGHVDYIESLCTNASRTAFITGFIIPALLHFAQLTHNCIISSPGELDDAWQVIQQIKVKRTSKNPNNLYHWQKHLVEKREEIERTLSDLEKYVDWSRDDKDTVTIKKALYTLRAYEAKVMKRHTKHWLNSRAAAHYMTVKFGKSSTWTEKEASETGKEDSEMEVNDDRDPYVIESESFDFLM